MAAPAWVTTSGLYGDAQVTTGCTQDGVSLLDEVFTHTLFEIGGAYHVAISWGCRVSDPSFFELTCDDPVEFYDWDHGWLGCGGPTRHMFTTEDTACWRQVDERTGESVGEMFRLGDVQDGSLTWCPACGAPVTAGGCPW